MNGTDRVLAGLFGATAFALYLLTLSPDVFWGDAAQLQYLAAQPEFGTDARSYPLYVGGSHVLWRLLPVAPAVAANLFAAVSGAVAVTLAWLVARSESGSRFGGAIAAVTLAVSHLHWSSSASAEVYSLSAVFLLLLLGRVRPAAEGRSRAIVGAGVIIGLSFLHHRIVPATALVATIPVVVAWVRSGRALRGIGLAALGFAAGVLPFVILRMVTADGPERLFSGASPFRLPGSAPGLAGAGVIAVYVGVFLAWNFAGPQIGLSVIGAIRAVLRPGVTGFTLAAMFLTGVGLPFLYPQLGDRYIFLLPAYVAVAVFAGIGAGHRTGIIGRPVVRALLLAAVAVIPPAAFAVAAAEIEPGRFGRFRGADPRHLTQILWPGRAERREPREFADRLFAALPENALLVHHWGEGQVIHYLRRIEGARPDLTLAEVEKRDWLDVIEEARSAGRTVWFTTYPFLPFPEETMVRFPCRPDVPGVLWRLDQP